MSSISDVIKSKGIQSIVHFTRLENLDSILRNGLHPRINIDNRTINGLVNDNFRADEKRHGSCLSISFPNSKMFYAARKNAENEDNWVVIAFSPQVLIDKDCAFFPTNAACNTVRHTNISNFKGYAAFSNMFASKAEGTSIIQRSEHGYLLAKDPTDVQAEVMVFDIIEPTYILGCVFKTNEALQKFSTVHPQVKAFSAQGKWCVFDDRKSSRINSFAGI